MTDKYWHCSGAKRGETVKDLTDHIAKCEELSRRLEWTGPELGQVMDQVTGFAQSFVDQIPQKKAIDVHAPNWQTDLPTKPSSIQNILTEFESELLPSGLNPVSGNFFGYVPGGGIPSAAMGDFLAAITNRYSGVYDACPGAAALEQLTVDWQRDMIGYPESAAGTLQSGGSLATFTCVLAARETRPFHMWPESVLYMSKEIHHCINKAILMSGLQCSHVRHIEVDENFAMDASALKKAVEEDRQNGLKPWMVFASGGTINTGAIDPLDRLADIAQEEGLWLHVDAAYGGFFLLTDQKDRFKGIERADSVVLDPHKGLFLPYGCGTALVRDGELLRKAFHYESDYLADVAKTQSSPSNYSPELTRHFRALRLWMTFKCHGIERLAAALQEKLLLAQYAHQTLTSIAGIEVGPLPMLSCATFRVQGDDEKTQKLLEHVLKDGTTLFSSTKLNGLLYLRMCILCFRSHKENVDAAIGVIQDAIRPGS
jgi:glutamate/tyrosine decarboxylase-like PLP-dependent enzyme